MNKQIFVTRRIPEEGLDLLRSQGYTVTVRKKDSIITTGELKKAVKNVDALLCLLTDPVKKPVIKAMRRCKVISTYAVGYNNIDLAAATEKGIAVTNTPGVLTEATADLAFGLLLAAARYIVPGDIFTRRGKFTGWAPMLMLGKPVAGRTLGIIGAGRIGTAMARRGAGFGMTILYYNRSRNETIENDMGGRKVELDELLRESDYISFHVPLTSETQRMIGKDEFNLMKPSAILVNTARGEVIDEKALAKALKSGRIFGAGLDVYEHEPKIQSALLKLPNVVLAPHLGSATDETRSRMSLIAGQNIIGILEGSGDVHCVNSEVLGS
jgi:glyoxylate reductase